MLAVNHLTRGKFTLRMKDETKVEIFVAIKSFLSVFILLNYYGSPTFFDVNLEKAHDESMKRLNEIL